MFVYYLLIAMFVYVEGRSKMQFTIICKHEYATVHKYINIVRSIFATQNFYPRDDNSLLSLYRRLMDVNKRNATSS